MKFSDLIAHVGNENLKVQNLLENVTEITNTKKKSAIEFVTDPDRAGDTMKAASLGTAPEYIGVVVWIPRSKLPDGMDPFAKEAPMTPSAPFPIEGAETASLPCGELNAQPPSVTAGETAQSDGGSTEGRACHPSAKREASAEMRRPNGRCHPSGNQAPPAVTQSPDSAKASPESLARGASVSVGEHFGSGDRVLPHALQGGLKAHRKVCLTDPAANSSRPSYEQVRMGDDLETCTNPACGFRGIQPHEVKCPFCGRRTSELGE